MRGNLHLLGKTIPAWIVAAVLIMATAGAATGAVLTGSVTGVATTTASQALVARVDGSVIAGADRGLMTTSDDGAKFTASAEVNTGDDYDVRLALANLSGDELTGELTLIAPDGVTLDVAAIGSGDIVPDIVRTGPFNWKFRLESSDNTSPDMRIRVALADDMPPGFYSIDGTLKQIAQ